MGTFLVNYKGALLKHKYKWPELELNKTKAQQAAIKNRLKSPDFGVLNVDGYANVNAQYQLNIP